jgi:hypothetical protein
MRHAVDFKKLNSKCFSHEIGFNPYGLLSLLAVFFFTVTYSIDKQQVLQS